MFSGFRKIKSATKVQRTFCIHYLLAGCGFMPDIVTLLRQGVVLVIHRKESGRPAISEDEDVLLLTS
jgi:hypothetical protein